MVSEFNELSSREKWDMYKFLHVKWACKQCGTVMTDGPNRAEPFPGSEVCCGHCDAVLTRRTGGGQSDPFNWIALFDKKKKDKNGD